jgi:hypothetical protein
MNANIQTAALATMIADLIVDLVNKTNGPVTLAQIDRDVPGFAQKNRPNHCYVIREKTEQVFWNGMSEGGYLALRDVIFERRVAIQFVNALPYLLQNCVVYDADWVPTVLIPAKAANLSAPRRLVRLSESTREAVMATAAANVIRGYQALVPAPMRFTADRFSL